MKRPTYKKRVGRRRVLSESIEVMLRDILRGLITTISYKIK
ncbi:hypothetical protein [Globicatella sanguinis]|nr:hypothetical protein [Globicatella sanguinis]MDK7630150.1 hypothetical protein [Globicatella sanguinis]WIK66582.1 hypothetical protein CYJ72_000265 [Globicatella sanguinis]WKT55987.1 hypothetical protein Q3C38_00265 [Globicatella sanguinis]